MKELDHFQLLADIGKYAKEKGIDVNEVTVWELMKILSKEKDVPF